MSRRPAAVLAALLVSGCAGARSRPAPPGPLAEVATPSVELAAPLAPGVADALDRPREAPRDASAASPERPRRSAPRPDRSGPPDGPGDPGGDDEAALRARVLAAARRLLGTRPRLDCSGYVISAFAAAGVTVALAPARSRSESLYRASRPVTRPRPGDLVFFHDTHDRDRNGRRGDRFTHVALVEAVDGSALTLLHRGGRRVERLRMDLSRPSDPAANDPVRVRRPARPAGNTLPLRRALHRFRGVAARRSRPEVAGSPRPGHVRARPCESDDRTESTRLYPDAPRGRRSRSTSRPATVDGPARPPAAHPLARRGAARRAPALPEPLADGAGPRADPARRRDQLDGGRPRLPRHLHGPRRPPRPAHRARPPASRRSSPRRSSAASPARGRTCAIAGFEALAREPGRVLRSRPATRPRRSGWRSRSRASRAAWGRSRCCSRSGIGLSRVYLGAHYPLDVGAGALLGVFGGLAARMLVA